AVQRCSWMKLALPNPASRYVLSPELQLTVVSRLNLPGSADCGEFAGASANAVRLMMNRKRSGSAELPVFPELKQIIDTGWSCQSSNAHPVGVVVASRSGKT